MRMDDSRACEDGRSERADLAKLTIVYLTHLHHAISLSLILHNNNNDKENRKKGEEAECTRNHPSHIPPD